MISPSLFFKDSLTKEVVSVGVFCVLLRTLFARQSARESIPIAPVFYVDKDNVFEGILCLVHVLNTLDHDLVETKIDIAELLQS
jgi:hypothetical protein